MDEIVHLRVRNSTPVAPPIISFVMNKPERRDTIGAAVARAREHLAAQVKADARKAAGFVDRAVVHTLLIPRLRRASG